MTSFSQLCGSLQNVKQTGLPFFMPTFYTRKTQKRYKKQKPENLQSIEEQNTLVVFCFDLFGIWGFSSLNN